MCKRVYLTAKEAEKEMQEARKADGFTGKMETGYISRMIKDAKRNSMIGDKLQLVVDPMYIHIPEWQRRLKLARAYAIGNTYNKYKWDVPKVLFLKGKLYVIDGQHRLFPDHITAVIAYGYGDLSVIVHNQVLLSSGSPPRHRGRRRLLV